MCISRKRALHKSGSGKKEKKENVKESSRDSVCIPLQGWQLDCVSASERVITGTQHKTGPLSILPANHRLHVKDRLWRLSHEPWASETKHSLTEQL